MTTKSEAGQAVAEMALVLPLLLLVMAGCLDLGRAFSVWLTLANASREGARYGCVYPTDTNGIIGETLGTATAAGLAVARSDVQVSMPEGTDGGLPVVVTVQYRLRMVTGYLVGAQPLLIRASTQMVIIGGGS